MRRIVIVGGGITGLTAALDLLERQQRDGGPRVHVTLLEAQHRLGGKIRTTPFAGVPAVDEGADAFLARVPEATELARGVGLGDDLTSPTTGAAAVWWERLHRIPDGLLLGMPTGAGALARSRLISLRGKARAALEPLRPRTSTAHDSLGRWVRARFGNQVHERLVDPLVGSIYATDTDHFSLAAVPQIADLAARERSVLLAGRRRPPALAGPVFFAPRGGMGALVDAVAARVVALGGQILTDAPCTTLEPDGHGWRIDGNGADGIILACPAPQAARLVSQIESGAARPLGKIEYADVVVVTMAVPAAQWPDRLAGLSGYLVPKPVQNLVTAVSFGSQKWSHWAVPGSVVLRVSLGRDGLPVLHLDDDRLVESALDDLRRHLGVRFQPTSIRISRWQRAFPQYRPHHARLVAEASAALPAAIALAGASYHGIGIPACVRSGRTAADAMSRRLEVVRE